MKNNTFLICELSKRNVFNIWLDTELHNIHNICKAKIDTGCMFTSIPIKTFLGNDTSNELALSLKSNAIASGLDYARGYGVSDTGAVRKKDRFLIKSGNLLDCTSVGFIHRNISIDLSGYSFSHDIRVNYDRTGNILIGMDILKEFDYHCGISKVTGKHTFIGVLDSQEDKLDYYRALKEHFGIIREHSFWAKLFKERYNK